MLRVKLIFSESRLTYATSLGINKLRVANIS